MIFPSEEKKEPVQSTSVEYQEPEYHSRPANRETKSLILRLILCLVCGTFGVHKFFEGKIISGIIYILTGGLFGVGIVVDTIRYILNLISSSRAGGDGL